MCYHNGNNNECNRQQRHDDHTSWSRGPCVKAYWPREVVQQQDWVWVHHCS